MSHISNVKCGICVGLLGYFAPIQNIQLVMICVIIFDFLIGLWACRKKGEGWQSVKMWRTVHKLFFATLIIMLLYAMDTEMGISYFQFHRGAACLITGFEIWSILENAAIISNHPVFRALKKLMKDELKNKF